MAKVIPKCFQMASIGLTNLEGFFNCTLQQKKDPNFDMSTCQNDKPRIFEQVFQRVRFLKVSEQFL